MAVLVPSQTFPWTRGAQASLAFASTNVVNCGSAASVDDCFANDGTLMWWMFPTATTAGLTFARKDAANVSFVFAAGGIQMSIARATQSLATIQTTANTPNFGTNKWVFLAAQWDLAGANGDQQWFGGDLFTSVSAVSTYATQRVGSGTVTDTSALSLLIGNTAAGNQAFPGSLAFTALWNRRLQPFEIEQQRLKPSPTYGCVLMGFLGANGLTHVVDVSGTGNHGLITGSPTGVRFPWGLTSEPMGRPMRAGMRL